MQKHAFIFLFNLIKSDGKHIYKHSVRSLLADTKAYVKKYSQNKQCKLKAY